MSRKAKGDPWYVLLDDRRRSGRHVLLAPWPDLVTTHLSRALEFPTQKAAQRAAASKFRLVMPAGFLAFPEQLIPPPPPLPARPRRRVATAYGPVRLRPGQALLPLFVRGSAERLALARQLREDRELALPRTVGTDGGEGGGAVLLLCPGCGAGPRPAAAWGIHPRTGRPKKRAAAKKAVTSREES